MLAIDTVDGRKIWEYKAGASIKASPSFHDGLIYVGNYQSSLLALNAKTGKFVWQTNTSTQQPFGKGSFYSSPAIAFGHVYAARDDGVVFAFDRKTGKIAWSFPTGGAVYGSPAVARVPGTPPTVYIGSENGRLFALDARDGKERWHQDVGGPIPGTASVIGNTVFSSSFETRESVGYDVHTHKRDFTLHSAGYSPVVSDGRRLYVAGYYTSTASKTSRRSSASGPAGPRRRHRRRPSYPIYLRDLRALRTSMLLVAVGIGAAFAQVGAAAAARASTGTIAGRACSAPTFRCLEAGRTRTGARSS